MRKHECIKNLGGPAWGPERASTDQSDQLAIMLCPIIAHKSVPQ